jgi:hypothetical protein
MTAKSLNLLALLSAAVAFATSASAETMKSDFFACRSEEMFDRGVSIGDAKDMEGLQKFLVNAIGAGQCVWIKAGTQVFWEASGTKFYNVRIRPQGNPDSYFTYAHLVK